MTDSPLPTPEPADSLPTEPLQLADQQPVDTAPAAAAAASTSSKHTVLAVVGGALAVGLIAIVGVLGFAIGHFTSDNRGDDRLASDRTAVQNDTEAGGPLGGQGQGMLPGQGVDPRGIDPDGDNWTGRQGEGRGHGQGMLPGQGTTPGQGTAPMTPTPQSSTSPSGT